MPHTIQISEFNTHDVISQVNNQLITTSLLVAETFSKLHKDILKKINNLDCSTEFNELNFAPVEYKDKKGEFRRLYNMTKDGFMFLVMSFTGKKAARVKEAYINAFNDMEAQLKAKEPTETLLLTYKQQRHIQAIVGTLAYEHEKSAHSIYHAIYKKFDVTSYTHLPKALYPDVCAYLDTEPKWELMDRIESELPARPITRLNFPERVTSLRYLTLSEMCDCGWSLQLNKMIRTIEQHEREGTDYRFDDISGLKQEIKSLCHLVEQQDMKLQNIKRIVS